MRKTNQIKITWRSSTLEREAKHQLSNIWSLWERECMGAQPRSVCLPSNFRSCIMTQVGKTRFILQPGCHVWITSAPPIKWSNVNARPVWKWQKGPSPYVHVFSSFPCVAVATEVPHPMMRSQDTMGWCSSSGRSHLGGSTQHWQWEVGTARIHLKHLELTFREQQQTWTYPVQLNVLDFVLYSDLDYISHHTCNKSSTVMVQINISNHMWCFIDFWCSGVDQYQDPVNLRIFGVKISTFTTVFTCIRARRQHWWWFIIFTCFEIVSMAEVTKPPIDRHLLLFFKGSIPVVLIAAVRKVEMDHTLTWKTRSCKNCRRRSGYTSSEELH